MSCAVHVLAGPNPTIFPAATDTLTWLEGRFVGGSNM